LFTLTAKGSVPVSYEVSDFVIGGSLGRFVRFCPGESNESDGHGAADHFDAATADRTDRDRLADSNCFADSGAAGATAALAGVQDASDTSPRTGASAGSSPGRN
jgi:hypothetical protein